MQSHKVLHLSFSLSLFTSLLSMGKQEACVYSLLSSSLPSLCLFFFICQRRTPLQLDLADMQLLVRFKMGTQKVFGRGLLMSNIYHSDMTMASSCWCVNHMCVNKCVSTHICPISFFNVCPYRASIMIHVLFYFFIKLPLSYSS